MKVALYLRRSTDEHQAQSIDTQRANATEWARGRGWSIVGEYIDSGTSRTDFSRAARKGWFAMSAAAKRREFDAVIVRDVSRIGGDVLRCGPFVSDLLETGARLFCYADGREITLANALECFMFAADSFGAQAYVEALRKATREAVRTRATRGLVAGGNCYGYENRRDATGVHYVINDSEAEIIREVFRRYAEGEGLRTIAHDLNARGLPSPRGGARTGSWAPSCLHAMLRRDRYIGRLRWGATSYQKKDGKRRRLTKPDCEVVTVDAPHLRIVEDAVWAAVQERTERFRALSPAGRSDRGRSKYLLSGIGRCAGCGGPMVKSRMRVAGGMNVDAYGCGWHRDRGATVCEVSLRRPVDAIDRLVVETIQRDVLTESVVLAVCAEVRRRLTEDRSTVDLDELQAEAATLRKEIDRLVAALAAFEDKPDAMVEGIKTRQARLRELDGRIRAAAAAPSAIDLEVRRLEKQARKRLGDLHAAFARNPDEARRALEALLTGPIAFRALDSNRFEVTGELGVARLAAAEGAGFSYVGATFEI